MQVNSNISAVITHVKPVTFHVYLSMRRAQRELKAAKPDAESLDSLLRNSRDNDVQVCFWAFVGSFKVCCLLSMGPVT